MMQCPVCGNRYTDASLRYCLADGTTLVPAEDETVVRKGQYDAVRVEIPGPETRHSHIPPPAAEAKSGSPVVKIILGLVALGAVTAVIGVIGAVLYFSYAGSAANQNAKLASPTPAVSPLPTIDAEKERLQKELASVQRKLDEQKNANRAANTSRFPEPSQPGVVTARVNSPNDGFLALRNTPDAEYGERLAKIPHGTVVTLEDCQRQRTTIGGRTGRWCMVTYDGTTGWVFDAWLDY
jgi:hypothetical protein